MLVGFQFGRHLKIVQFFQFVLKNQKKNRSVKCFGRTKNRFENVVQLSSSVERVGRSETCFLKVVISILFIRFGRFNFALVRFSVHFS